ncbi:hypothetical protein [Bradyrhizobium sp. LMTR 3]|uniref:hypothetical protein n=1 Tax=Bradyrhizobium sp. LMTR 3 TaxID=189873 RepID=UPI0011465824|nr:hypothetical protein [Bradyrhizobium sp. LMTR 3]
MICCPGKYTGIARNAASGYVPANCEGHRRHRSKGIAALRVSPASRSRSLLPKFFAVKAAGLISEVLLD